VCCSRRSKLILLSVVIGLFSAGVVCAADNESKSLDELVIEAPKAELRDIFDDFMPIPTSKFKVDRTEIDNINTISIEDTVRYSPGLEIRRRYIGDPNGVISMRGNGNFQTARHMLFVDGFPLHSMLRTQFNGAPQWNFVAPDETDHVDITYGPFSPKYSGNAMGGVIEITSRQPQNEEWALQTTGWVQDWKFGESEGNAPGYKTFFAHGNKVGKLSYYMFYNRLETQTQPTDLIEKNGVTTGGAGTAVTGAVNFIDPRVRDSIAFSDDGEESSINDLFKMKMNYDFSPQLKLRGLIGFLDRHRDQLNVNNYLRTAGGNKIWTGTLNLNGKQFTVAENDFDVGKQDKQDLLAGLGASGEFGGGWNYDALMSAYVVLQDDARDSDENPDSPAFDNSGQLTELTETGWQLFELRFDKSKFLGRTDFSFEGGYHYDHAKLKLATYTGLPDWQNSNRNEGTFGGSSGGQTDTHAIHGNLGWEFAPKWDLQVGGRAEFWRSFNGFKHTTATEIGGHAERDETAFSPKASIGFKPTPEWDLRASAAQATRFALPEELFSNVSAFNTNNIANPGLKPEEGTHVTVMVGNFQPKATTQISFFWDDVTDTIFNDQDDTSGTTVSTFVNIDKVRTRGAELVLKRRDFLIPKHDFDFNLTYVDAEIREHRGNTAVEGNELPRTPNFRVKMQSVYHFLDNWDAMVAARWQDEAFGRIQNDDILSGTGGQDEYFFMDMKTTYRHKNLNASFGINNLTDEGAFTGPHQYENRTYSIDLKWKFM